MLILAENLSGLAKVEGITVEELCERFGDDLRLMEEIGWVFETDQESIELVMPAETLAETLKQLRRDASVDERWRRFRQAVEVCEELLDRLDSLAREQEDETPLSAASPEQVASHELSPYRPVTDGFILAAVERAALHEQEEEVLTSDLTHHLGFEGKPATNRLFFPRLEELRQAGLLTSTERRGEPFWSLTSVGREQLANEREAGEVGDLPESPQHRAWRHARGRGGPANRRVQRPRQSALGRDRRPPQSIPPGELGRVVRVERAAPPRDLAPWLRDLLLERMDRAGG
ncbi:MAG TPA: hypothetical protein VHQ43_00830 [Solirubrobacterales bacterium]|nr:hypothetical protein [Solirubrobacterales bacterium]